MQAPCRHIKEPPSNELRTELEILELREIGFFHVSCLVNLHGGTLGNISSNIEIIIIFSAIV